MERYDAAILGAGPSGLTAAYRLARRGKKVAVVERAPFVGGLMRGVKRNGFSLDVGRKELYSRLPDVDALWREILGDDYREYDHHVGRLHGGRILELTSKPKGKLRNLSPTQIVRMLASYVLAQIKPGSRRATNQEEYYLLRYGRAYYEAYVEGFTRKFLGADPKTQPAPLGIQTIPRFPHFRKAVAPEVARPADVVPDVWRHPAQGTTQIVEALEAGAREGGAEFLLETEVVALNHVDGRVRSVTLRRKGETFEIEADNVVVGVPLPLLMPLVLPAPPEEIRSAPKGETALKRSAVLVYLFADEPPKFPHNWLEVTDMKLAVGRIVNYATWNCRMVPEGKTALCMEYFCLQGDPILDRSDDDLVALAKKEAADNGLIDPSKVFDALVLKLPMANASTSHDDWRIQWMRRASEHLHAIQGLHETNRPGMDYATLAGIDAAEACLSGRPMSMRSLDDPYAMA